MDLNVLERYKELMEKSLLYYNSEADYLHNFGRVPKFRYHTLKFCLEHIIKYDLKNIVELGTTRSFVDGRFTGCNSDDVIFWEPNNPNVWDWAAGCFTRIIGEFIQGSDIHLESVDLESSHINRSKKITEGLHNIKHFTSSSEDYLTKRTEKIDFLYMDTGNVTPIEETAQLHLRESKILIDRDLISKNGIILIDDVRNIECKKQDVSEYGKAKYSVELFLDNGYKLVSDEYQIVLVK